MTPSRIDACVSSMPCAEVFFKCQDALPTNGTGSMVCSITGATYKPTVVTGVSIANQYGLYPVDTVNTATGIAANTVTTPSPAIYPQCSTSQTLASGSWPNFKRRHVIIFAAGRVVDATARAPIGLGDSNVGDGTLGFSTNTGGDLSIAMTTSMHLAVASSNVMLCNPFSADARRLPAAGTDVAMILEYSPGVIATAKCIGTDGKTFGSGTSETIFSGVPTSVADVNPGLNNYTRLHGLAFYSFMAFSFDNGLPPARDYVYQWLLNQHLNGVRVLPPWWKDEVSSR